MAQVLLLEPDKLLANTFVQALKTARISTNWVSKAQDAIIAMDTKRPKLIIVELQLTNHNGVEFLYELRSHIDLKDIPVILHSIIPAVDLGLDTATKQRLHIIDYWYKPQTSLQELVSQTKKVLNSQKKYAKT